MSLLNSFFIDFIKRKKYNIFKGSGNYGTMHTVHIYEFA